MAVRLFLGLSPAAAASLALCAAAPAAVIDGTVTFPSRFAPSMVAYAADVDYSRVNSTPLARGQTSFSLEVPPGRYWVFLAPDEPGSPDIYGAFTHYSLCARESSDPCLDHSPVEVAVSATSPRATVTIDDWYLTDEVADAIDRLRGLAAPGYNEPLGAPRFSEYPSESLASDAALRAAPAVDFSDSGLNEDDRQALQQALASGANFAGHLTAALTHCGAQCARIVLVDRRTGKLLEPAALDDIQGDLPCRAAEAHVFRRDSRLLSVTRTRSTQVVTQYYVWNQKNAALVLVGEYRRSPRTFCEVAAR